MDSQLRSQLRNVVHVARKRAPDDYAQNTYEEPEARRARVTEHSEIVRDATGREHDVANHVILEDVVDLEDRIWLPGEDPKATEGRRIVKRGIRYDEVGEVDHVKLWIRRRSGGNQ